MKHHALFELSSIIINYLQKRETKYTSLIDNSVSQAKINNPWFIEKFVCTMLSYISSICDKDSIEKYVSDFKPAIHPKKVLVIAAGNIPMVSFHDVISVLLSGHTLIFKPSSKDTVLMKMILFILQDIEPSIKNRIYLEETTLSSKELDAVIATGTNNTATYIHQYFSKYPRIVRNNKTSVAIIDNTTTDEELKNLSHDILLYFGLGCRNVSKIFIPQNFDIQRIFKAVYDYGFFIQHYKYMNNYDYYRSIYLLNKEEFLENNFLILKESTQLHAPVANLFYEKYEDIDTVHNYIKIHEAEIQTIVGKNHTPFGQAQFPEIDNFADGINTKEFLMML